MNATPPRTGTTGSTAIVFLALVLSASVSSATVIWRGGFEDGTRSEFSRYHAAPADPPRINVVSKPAADGYNTRGSLAARCEVRTGDDARKLSPETGEQIGSNDYNERAELAVPTNFTGHTYIREGDDLWITWQTMFPAGEWWGTDPKGGGTVFFQIHHVRVSDEAYDGSPPLMFVADNDAIRVTQCMSFPCSNATLRHERSIESNHWYTFVVHAKHSSDPAKGRLEVWIDGSKVVDNQTALLFGSDFGNYILTGMYRRPNTVRTGVLFMDNYLIGTAQADVAHAISPAQTPTDPTPTDPTPTDPTPTDPTPTDPTPTDPTPTDPTPTDPRPTDPTPTDPTPTDPTPSDPETPIDPNGPPTDPATPEVPGSGGDPLVPGKSASGCTQSGQPLWLGLLVAGYALSLARARRRRT